LGALGVETTSRVKPLMKPSVDLQCSRISDMALSEVPSAARNPYSNEAL
jgi:hypothetical protein